MMGMGMWVDATCPECEHKARVPANAVECVVCEHGAQVTWVCPGCQNRQAQSVSDGKVKLLRGTGVRMTVIAAEEGGRGDPITEDDLIAFGLAIEAAEVDS